MKKTILASLLFTGSMCAATLVSATTATYQYCSTDGCRVGGSATVNSDYAKMKYPLVMAHGMGGFSAIGPIEHWYNITNDLTANGAKVFATESAAFNSSEVRGEQLLTQVKEVLAITGASKVNLIGHSHGAQSIRYVAGLIPNQVASVTTVGGPNKGSPVADTIYTISKVPVVGTSVIAPVLSAAVNAFFSFVDIGSGHYYDQDSLAGLYSLTSKGTAEFNAKFPNGVPASACGAGDAAVNQINYYSWGGTSVLTNVFDPFDYLVSATSFLIPGENDGLVPRCSNHFGKIIRDNYPHNHFDEVNQALGLIGLFAPNPVTLYRQQANRLKLAGL